MKSILLTTIAVMVLLGCSESSIHQAAIDGNIQAVKKHIAGGTDVNVKNKYKRTPLIQAAWGGHKEITELLIAKGADVNAKDDDGDTPLLYAYSHLEIANILRKHGGKTAEESKDEGK